jgi:hypothetical protein
MSIFRKASELDNLPTSVSDALFENHDINFSDEFEGLLKEASSNRSVYDNRVKSFREAGLIKHDFQAGGPALYQENQGGIRRASFGQRLEGEKSELFNQESIRSIGYDNNKYAENLLENGFSIWEPTFDDIQDAFDQSQKQSDAVFDRKSMAEKKAATQSNWESKQVDQIRKANVLPYRGLGVCRLANETQIHHDNFGTFDEFYAEASDSIHGMIVESNTARKAKISRKGVSPTERIDQWQNKEAIAARTMEALENSSLMAKFADSIGVDLYD